MYCLGLRNYASNLHHYSIPNFLKKCIIIYAHYYAQNLLIIPIILAQLFWRILQLFYFCNQKLQKYFITYVYY